MKTRSIWSTMVFVVLSAFLSFAQAAGMPIPVPVSNPSFESPAIPENTSGVADGWLSNPGPAYAGIVHLFIVDIPTVPDGEQVAFAGIGGSLTQTLSSMLTANTLYTLEVDVGRQARNSNTYFTHSVRLLAGTTIVAQGSVDSLAPGEFKTLKVTFLAEASNPDIGSALGIQLYSPVPAGSQVLFDNVKLTASTAVSAFKCPNFEPPMGNGPVTVKKNRVLPFKGTLLSDSILITNMDIIAPPVIQVLYDSGEGDATDVTNYALPVGQGTEGNQFEFDGTWWHFNMGTKGYTSPGTYTVSMVSGDLTEYVINPTCTAQFIIK
ncbi:MAG: hypothetical protein RKP73_04195 [Candidatus Contendobacter sp.]|nr:hypothetical protein [Candidatus Contendobacter sp.]